MLFLLIFPILVSGFFACHIHPYHFYKLHRYEGQYLYLKSAEMGLKCFGLAFLVAAIAHYQTPDTLTLCHRDFSFNLSTRLGKAMVVMGAEHEHEASKMAWFFILSILTFLSAIFLKWWGHLVLWLRFRAWNSRIYVIGELLDDSPLDSLLFNLSLQKDKYVMLTMNDRKVYVGKIISLGEPTETNGMDQDISIMPLMSGYRDKDTLKVEFKTFYEQVSANIYLSLRQDAILSATEFDFKAYRVWNPAPADLSDISSERKKTGHNPTVGL